MGDYGLRVKVTLQRNKHFYKLFKIEFGKSFLVSDKNRSNKRSEISITSATISG